MRRRLRAVPAGGARAAALQLREIKLELAEATGEVSACSSCASGKEWPRGVYRGGDCCSGRAELVFSDDEVAALALSGTRARDLTGAGGEPGGCAFRGPTGCSLAVEHRPSICVRYACNSLQRELHRLGRLDEVEQLAIELREALAAFAAAQAAWRADVLAAELVSSLA